MGEMVRRVYRSGKWVTQDTPKGVSFASYTTRCNHCHAECIMSCDGAKAALTDDGKKIHECRLAGDDDMFDVIPDDDV